MAVLKLVNNPCDTEEALRNLCHYVVRMDRTMGNVGGRGVRASAAYEDFCMAQSLWGKNHGRRAYHFVLSFDDMECLIPCEAMAIAVEVSSLFFPCHQVVFGVHTQQEHLHIHMAVNTVALDTGLKLHIDFEMLRYLRSRIDGIVNKYTL